MSARSASKRTRVLSTVAASKSGARFNRSRPRTASSMPLLNKNIASYRWAFCMTAFLSAAWPRVRQLTWRVGTHVSDGVGCRPGWTHAFSWAELRRGMRNAQGDGACDGDETEMARLHPEGEPDIFYSSH